MTQGPVDPTLPGDGGYPGGFEPTAPMPQVPGPPGGPPGGLGGEPEEGDNRRKWLFGGLAFVAVVALGVVIALLVSSGEEGSSTSSTSTSRASTTTSSSTSTSTSTSTSSTTVPPSTTAPAATPTINSYAASPNPVTCPNTSSTQMVTLTWSTSNATGVTVSIDGPGPYNSYPPNGSAQVPFACAESQHTYQLVANGAGGTTSAPQTRTVTRSLTPSSTTTSTTS
jgi:hypothetical protein